MDFYKLPRGSTLTAYYRVFSLIWGVIFFILLIIVFRVILRESFSRFIEVYFLTYAVTVAVGVPLLYWARDRAEFLNDPRPMILASGMTVLAATAPILYFLAKPLGFDPIAAFWTLVVAVCPLIVLYIRPPRKLFDRLHSRRKQR